MSNESDPFAPKSTTPKEAYPLTHDGAPYAGPPPPPPENTYVCTCLDVELKPAGQSGYQYYLWTFRIDDECDWMGEEVSCISSLSPSAKWGMQTMMRAFEFEPKGKATFDPADFRGKKVCVRTVLEEYPVGSGVKLAKAKRVSKYAPNTATSTPF